MVGARGGKVTIRDVAAIAGVSYQTVSRVLNKSPNVSPAALAKVEDAVARLGYSPAEAVEHLAALGHRRIAFINGSAEYPLNGERLGGFRDAVDRLGLDRDPALVGEGDFSFASGEAAAIALLDLAAPPTAIIASSDAMAPAAIAVGRARGRTSVPLITAINQPTAEMTAPGKGDPGPHIIPLELIARQSSGPVRA